MERLVLVNLVAMNKPILFLTTLVVLCPVTGFTQNKRYNDNFQQEYFFGNVPSARTEAMAKTDVAIGGAVSSSFFNPAGTGLIKKSAAQLSYSKPYYALTRSRYYYAGYAMKWKKFTFGLTYHRYEARAAGWTIDVGYKEYRVNNPITVNSTVNVVYEPIENLYVGLNYNTYFWTIFDDVGTDIASHADVGLLYIHKLTDNEHRSRLQFGASVNNFTTATITYHSPDDTYSTSPFPVVARGGLAWMSRREMKIPGSLLQVDVTASAQYQTLFNNSYREGINIGTEAEINDVFAFRLGYWTYNLNDNGFTTNKSRVRDITYGFGVLIPCKEREFRIDYAAMKAPAHSTRGTRLPNFHTFTFQYFLTKQDEA